MTVVASDVSETPTRTPERERPRRRRNPTEVARWVPYAFMAPGLVLFLVTFAWPGVIAIQLAFMRYNVVSPPTPVGLDNFVAMFSDAALHRAMLNSAVFMVLFLPLVVVVPLFLAMLVNRPLRGIQTFRMLYYLPVVTSMVAVAVAWRFVLSMDGVASWFLNLIGLPSVSFLLSPDWALPSVVIIEAWKNMGFYMIIYLAGLQAIPTELIEAAKVDGASAWRRVWHVIVPGLRPVFAVTLTLGMLSAIQAFESIFTLTRGGPQNSTLTLGYYMWSKAFEEHDMGYASAVGLVVWAIMIVLSLLNLRATRNVD